MLDFARSIVWWTVAATFLSTALPAAAEQDELAAERSIFRKIYPKAERGDWNAVAPHLAQLRDYPLFPDLRAAYLQSRLDEPPDREIGAFLAMHPDLSASRALRYRWAKSLAKRARWKPLLRTSIESRMRTSGWIGTYSGQICVSQSNLAGKTNTFARE